MDQQSIKNIIKLLSIIGIYLSLFFLIPIIVGVYYEENINFFLLFNTFFFCINLFLYFILKNHILDLSLKDGIFSVNLIWILVGFAGGIPLWIYSDITLAQSIFESISGFTTTGATIYADIENLPHFILILRSLMHWVGGMGILVLGIGLLSIINPSGSLAIFKAESSGIRLNKSTPKIKDTALMLWGIYLFLTFVDFLLLKLFGMNYFDAINHAFSTISTGGFSTKNASLGAFSDSNYILWTTTFFMIISGITFLAHLKLLSGTFEGYKNEETKWYLIIFAFLALLLTITKYDSNSQFSFFDLLTHASFNVASLMTTTGFASIDYEQWGTIAIVIFLFAMLSSGNGGSTSGGVKIIRYVVTFKVLFIELKKILHPNAFIKVFINDSAVSNSLISMTFAFIVLFVTSNAILGFFLFANGHDMITSLTTALACIGNIGPGFGNIGPSENYSFFSDSELIVLCIGMIIGRLEIFTFLLIFLPSFWRKF